MLDRLTRHIITFLPAFALAGCSIMEHNDGPCPEPEDPEYINISFRMVAPIEGNSRTETVPGHTEADSEWPEFEDRIYTEDIAFYIYAVLSDGTEPLLIKVDDFTTLTDPHTSISGGPESYTLKISLPKTDFENIVPSDEEDIKLRIVAFANTNRASSTSSVNYSSFRSLIGAASDWSYMMSGMIYSGTGGYRNNPKIPMYGTAVIEVSREEFYKTQPYAPLWGPDIYMLRSIAKLKVIDNIADRDKTTGLPQIVSVSFHGKTNRAYMLPYDAENYTNGMQVETPKPCDGSTMQITMDHNQLNRIWIGYIPEQYFDESEPKVRIDIVHELMDDGTPADPEIFEVPLSGYKNQKFDDFGNAILRNHIYTLSVDRIINAEADIKVKVKEWVDMPELNLDYTEPNVVVSGKLHWDENTYQNPFPSNSGLDETEADKDYMVIMREWATVNGKSVSLPLDGTFTIDSPEGAIWTAYILQTGGLDGDAFAFQEINADGEFIFEEDDYAGTMDGDLDDAEEIGSDLSGGTQPLPIIRTPKLVNSVSGIISAGKAANLKIYTRHDKPSGNVANRAIIQVLVTVNNGGLVSVTEAPVNPDGVKRYIIVQNPY